MKVMRYVVLGSAVGAALIAGYIGLQLVNKEPETIVVKAPAPKMNTVDVLVAAQNINMGYGVEPSFVEWQAWPREGIRKGFITRAERPDAIEELSKTVAKIAIFEGEPVRESKLVETERGFMAAILPEGKRAIATAISADTGAGGFILPNDRVDVLMTRRGEKRGSQASTMTILENVRVLAIDQEFEEKDGKKVVVGETATLELTPSQTEVLTVAQQMADRLTLTLRSIVDSQTDESKAAESLLSNATREERGAVRIIKYGRTLEVQPKN